MVQVLYILNIVFTSILLIWYGLKLIGIPKLVTRTIVTEAYKIAIITFLFIVGLIGAILNLTFGEWILLITLVFWGYVQYKNHWYWIANQPSEEDIQKYKERFGENFSLFKREENKIMPDLYHILLHLIAIGTFTIIAIRLVQAMTYLPS